MTRKPISVTACVPAYNAGAFIEPTLASLLAQSHPHLDILVSIDRSADDTADICERLAASDPRIRVLRQTRRLGWLENVNILLRECRSEALFIAAHDDIVHPKYVESLARALEIRPEAALACSDLVLHHQGRRDIRGYRYGASANPLLRGLAMLFQFRGWWIPYRGLVRRAAIEHCGGLVPSRVGEFSADWPWLLGLALWGPLVRVPEPLYEKHLLKTSLSQSWDYRLDDWKAVDDICRQAIRRSRLPDSQRNALLTASRLCGFRHRVGVAATRLLKRPGVQ
jgi:glycosyltransferase involved in cell wall biosynthesis